MNHRKENQRNYGIDLLRIVSMFFVLVLHCLGHGGVLANARLFSSQYNVAWLLETAGYCAVNCYALISGYVGLNSRSRLSSLIMLWLQVAFYNVGFSFVEMLWLDQGFVWEIFLEALHPVSSRAYWYFTAYTGMFFFIPLLNAAVQNLERKQLEGSLVGILILFSVYVALQKTDVFLLNHGYHALWLMIMYVLGAYLRKYNAFENMKAFVWVLVYGAMVLLSWGVLLLNTHRNTVNPDRNYVNLVEFTSPTMMVAAVALLQFFSRVRISGLAEKVIRFVAPLTFSVYLIHDNALLRDEFMIDQFIDLAFYPIHRMLLKLGFICVVLFIACITVDHIRSLLFRWLRLRKIAELPEKLLAGIRKGERI